MLVLPVHQYTYTLTPILNTKQCALLCNISMINPKPHIFDSFDRKKPGTAGSEPSVHLIPNSAISPRG